MANIWRMFDMNKHKNLANKINANYGMCLLDEVHLIGSESLAPPIISRFEHLSAQAHGQ